MKAAPRQVTGTIRLYNRDGERWKRFTIELPEGSFVHYDANQSTVVVKDDHGRALAAVREVKQFAVTGLSITWTEEPSDRP